MTEINVSSNTQGSTVMRRAGHKAHLTRTRTNVEKALASFRKSLDATNAHYEKLCEAWEAHLVQSERLTRFEESLSIEPCAEQASRGALT